MYELTSFDFG